MEYKYERFTLSKFCEFRDREIEASYMEFEKAADLVIVRVLTLLLGFTFAMFAFADYYFYGSQEYFGVAIGLRAVVLVLTAIFFFTAGKIKTFDKTLTAVTLLELAVFAIYLFILFLLKAREPALQFMSVMLFILTVFLIPNRWKNCLGAGFVIWAGYIGFCALFQDIEASPSLTQRAIYLGICYISCSIFLYGRASSQRRHFAAEQLLEFMSITDKLTGINNRSRFEHLLGQWIKNRRHDPFCLLFLDIDDFKLVNDRYGHNEGDRVLVNTTTAVSSNIRDDDIFARWGGEEFVILFADTGIERAAELAERLRKAVEANPCGEAGKITISIGVVQYRREAAESLLDFVNRADEKMYEAKQAGKNRIAVEKLPAQDGALSY